MCHLPVWSHTGREVGRAACWGFKCLAGSEAQAVRTAAQVSCVRTPPLAPLTPGRIQCGTRLFQSSEKPRMFLKAVVLTLALVAVTGE